MNAEIPDNNENGWIFFDAECGLCSTLAQRFAPFLHRHRFALMPLQTPWVKERLSKSGNELLSEMRLLTPRGDIYGGADALIAIVRQIWWAWPIYWLSDLPAVRPALRRVYGWIARHRTCADGGCPITVSSKSFRMSGLAWIPAVVLPILAVILGGNLPGWVWMWVLVVALFLGAKWITIPRMLFTRGRVNAWRLLAYFLLWPGMDARAFCERGSVPAPPVREWIIAGANTSLGVALLWIGVPLAGTTHPLVSGWTGMLGIVFLLHFGLFHLLSLFWCAFGINARPIMQSPGNATSLSGFWGRRWNAAFADLMQEHLFKPLAKYCGPRGALLMIFLISGALHELVISLPAHGGYGLPTIYFVIQGLGLLFERSKPGWALGLGSGLKGWCFVALVAGLPVFWLFHPIFIHNVILPMLHAIGTTNIL